MSGADIPEPPTPDDDVPDTEAITDEFPAVGAARGALDGTLVWLVTGGVIGLVALVVFTGGLGRSSGGAGATDTVTARTAASSPPGTTSRPRTATQATMPATTTPSTTTPTATAARSRDVLRVEAVAAQGLYFEVRRGASDGDVVFAGTLAQGEARRFRIPADRPLWLSVAWAPSARATINGAAVVLSGGTEAYIVTADGVKRQTGDVGATTTR